MATYMTKRTMLSVVTAGLLLSAARIEAADFYLRAAATTNTMPDGARIVMWGFALEGSFNSSTGLVTVPGPALKVAPRDSVLRIHLANRLPEPVSIVIPGQFETTDLLPTRNTDGRARSLAKETPVNNSTEVVYTWSNLQPGTYLYHSGSHPAIQVPMGLYGSLTKRASATEAYPGMAINSEVTLLYSEIDPALNAAVAANDFGPGKSMSSTIYYTPRYYLINGKPYASGASAIYAGAQGTTTLLRFLNASMDMHVPILNGFNLHLVAEDGAPYPYPKQMYSVRLPALKTIDALVTPTVGVHALYDRRLNLINNTTSPGGMLTYLQVVGQPTLTIVSQRVISQNPYIHLLQLGVTGTAGTVAAIDRSTNLTDSPNWTQVATLTNVTGSASYWVTNRLEWPALFFRVRLVP